MEQQAKTAVKRAEKAQQELVTFIEDRANSVQNAIAEAEEAAWQKAAHGASTDIMAADILSRAPGVTEQVLKYKCVICGAQGHSLKHCPFAALVLEVAIEAGKNDLGQKMVGWMYAAPASSAKALDLFGKRVFKLALMLQTEPVGRVKKTQ